MHEVWHGEEGREVTAPVCEHPAHFGSGRLVDRRDLLEERTEWRDVVTQARFLVRQRRRVCRDCARRDVARIDGVTGDQAAML